MVIDTVGAAAVLAVREAGPRVVPPLLSPPPSHPATAAAVSASTNAAQQARRDPRVSPRSRLITFVPPAESYGYAC